MWSFPTWWVNKDHLKTTWWVHSVMQLCDAGVWVMHQSCPPNSAKRRRLLFFGWVFLKKDQDLWAHYDVFCLEMWTERASFWIGYANFLPDVVETGGGEMLVVWLHNLVLCDTRSSRLNQHLLYNWVSFNLTDEWISVGPAVDTLHRTV